MLDYIFPRSPDAEQLPVLNYPYYYIDDPDEEITDEYEELTVDEMDNSDIIFEIESLYPVTDARLLKTTQDSWSAAYPNPTNTELTIDRIKDESSHLDLQSNRIATIVLLYSHSTTRLVFSQDYPPSTQQIKINTSKLANVIYYLKIIENGKRETVQTILVNP